MGYKVYRYTNRGGRDNNEDFLDFRVSENSALFVLADGLGGHQHGEVASKIAVESMMERFSRQPIFSPEILRDAVCRANACVLEKQRESGFSSIRTTLAVLYFDADKVLWAHAGDSRVYGFGDGALQLVTADHSVTYRKFASGMIARDEMNVDDDRSSLLRCLGKAQDFEPEMGGLDHPPKPQDAFLLCSDGFWENVYDTEMLADRLKSDLPNEWVDYMLIRHLERSKADGDNYSIIAIMAYTDSKH